ncbi:MAG: hypothetical protein ACK5JT_20410 [Hyphomicrobiaceae bacterium]
MNRLHIIGGALALSLGLASASAQAATETGFHNIHALKRVGGKLCMADHAHAGESQPTGKKSVAVKLAINNWASFTAFEYGSVWGRFSRASAKTSHCTGGPGNWVCQVTARPCRSR